MNREREKVKSKIDEALILATFLPEIELRLAKIFKLKREEETISKQQLRLFKLLESDKDKSIIKILINEYKELSIKKKRLLNFLINMTENLYLTENFEFEVNPGLGGKEAEFFAKELFFKYKELILKDNLYLSNKNLKQNESLNEKSNIEIKIKKNHFLF